MHIPGAVEHCSCGPLCRRLTDPGGFRQRHHRLLVGRQDFRLWEIWISPDVSMGILPSHQGQMRIKHSQM